MTVGAAVASAAVLVVPALAWSLLRLEAVRASAGGVALDAEFLELNTLNADVFAVRLVALFVAIGASGWMGSRALGVFTTAVGAVAGLSAVAVVLKFAS